MHRMQRLNFAAIKRQQQQRPSLTSTNSVTCNSYRYATIWAATQTYSITCCSSPRLISSFCFSILPIWCAAPDHDVDARLVTTMILSLTTRLSTFAAQITLTTTMLLFIDRILSSRYVYFSNIIITYLIDSFIIFFSIYGTEIKNALTT